MEITFSWMDVEFIGRIILSAVLGGIIGFERELSRKPAGLRTHIFICMGSTLFTISSIYLIPSYTGQLVDATRIAAGIVTGTAFIGAGSIIALRADVKGLTTAASLWIIGAIGLMVGIGNYLLPITATIITFIILHYGSIMKNKVK